MKKAAAGAVLVGGVLATLFGAAGTAQADVAPAPKPGPGVSVSVDGGKAVGIGNQGPLGAQATSTKGNAALAVSLGISPIGTHATAVGGSGNTAFALEGVAQASGGGDRNSAVAVGGANFIGQGSDNHTFAALGLSATGAVPGSWTATPRWRCAVSRSSRRRAPSTLRCQAARSASANPAGPRSDPRSDPPGAFVFDMYESHCAERGMDGNRL